MNMDEKDIVRLIEAEQSRRHRADAEHVRRLSREVGGDAEAFCAHRRLLLRVAATVLIILLPGVYALLRPQRVDNRHVLCNQRGGEMLVLNRACSALGTCDDPNVVKFKMER
jgi:hypothetical protein